MAISISCGKCGKRYSVKDELAGKKFRCKACESLIAVPSRDDDDPFGGMNLKSTGNAFDEDVDEDAPVRSSSSKARQVGAKKQKGSSKKGSGIPAIVVAGMSCWSLSLAHNVIAVGMMVVRHDPTILILIFGNWSWFSAWLLYGLLRRRAVARSRVADISLIIGVFAGLLFAAFVAFSFDRTPLRDPLDPSLTAMVGILFALNGVAAVSMRTKVSKEWFCE